MSVFLTQKEFLEYCAKIALTKLTVYLCRTYSRWQGKNEFAISCHK